jgi:aminoglycoside 3-N-acetyltransferase
MMAQILYKILPEKQFRKLAKLFHQTKKKIYTPFSEEDFKRVLQDEFQIKKGDTVAVHSSMDKLNIAFSPYRLLEILLETVGEEGNLLFPCWQFFGRTEDYVTQPDVVFDVAHDPSKLGLLSELARRHPEAVRSAHPTASVCVIGKNAQELTETHHLDSYPCGTESPFYKMLTHHGKIIGLGEKIVSLTFLHCIEDVLRDIFPIETKHKMPVQIPVNLPNGNRITCEVFYQKNLFNKISISLINKNISKEACRSFSYRGSNFFVCDVSLFFNEMKALTEQGKTIYGNYASHSPTHLPQNFHPNRKG